MRTRIYSLIVVVVSCGASLVLLEWTIRHFRLIADTAPIQYRLMPAPEYFSPKPLSSTTSIYGVEYRLNSWGLRGPEAPETQQTDAVRITLLGDSVAFGYGVAEQDTLATRLQTLLNESGGQRYQVFNLGVPASDSHNQAARFHRLASRIEPDRTVVLVLCNDLVSEPTRFRIGPSGMLARVHRDAPYPDSWRPTLESSSVFQLAMHIYGTLLSPDAPFRLDAYPDLRANLKQVVSEASGYGDRAIIAATPSRNVPPERYEEFVAKLNQDFADQPESDFIDLSIAPAPLGQDGYLPNDRVHPNAAGFNAVADALLPLLRGPGTTAAQ